MRALMAILVCTLTACSTPGRHFRGIDPVRITVEGSVFDIRVRGNLAEAIRINPQYAPRLGPLAGRAALAMAQVSECNVVQILGDQAVLTGILQCADTAPQYPAAVPQGYDCSAVIPLSKTDEEGAELNYECFAF